MSTDQEWVREKLWQTADRATTFGVLQSVSIAIALGTSDELNRVIKTSVGFAAAAFGIAVSTAVLVWVVYATATIGEDVGASTSATDVDIRSFLRHGRNLRITVLGGFALVALTLLVVIFAFGSRS